jgi:hypothetical protein
VPPPSLSANGARVFPRHAPRGVCVPAKHTHTPRARQPPPRRCDVPGLHALGVGRLPRGLGRVSAGGFARAPKTSQGCLEAPLRGRATARGCLGEPPTPSRSPSAPRGGSGQRRGRSSRVTRGDAQWRLRVSVGRCEAVPGRGAHPLALPPRRGLTEGVPEAKPPRHAKVFCENFFRSTAPVRSQGRAPSPRGSAPTRLEGPSRSPASREPPSPVLNPDRCSRKVSRTGSPRYLEPDSGAWLPQGLKAPRAPPRHANPKPCA